MRLVRSFSSNGHTRRNGSGNGNGVAGANSRDDVYTHGHHASVISQHQARTASNSARFLLPHLQPEMKVLDVGCGPGSISVGLAQATQPGGYLVALDISKEIVEVAGRALADAGLESSCYECKAGSVYDLSSYEDSYFDVAFAHQVLQHLSAPVEALVELKRVVKPGGVIAIRDADYSSMLGYPNLRGIDRWRELYRETARRNNAQPDAGRYLVSWGRQAGFEEIQFTTSVMQYSSGDEESRKRWASDWADRSLKSDFAKQAVAYGIASADEMQSISEAWLEWGENADAVFYYVNGEVLLRVP